MKAKAGEMFHAVIGGVLVILGILLVASLFGCAQVH